MRETARGLLETLVIRVLGVAPGGTFSEFRRIVIQDGSSFAIKDALKEVFPGRFKKVKPAAVELHATLDLLDESLSKVTLTADTASERAALPKASSLGGCLLMADRGLLRPGLPLGTDEGGGELCHPCPERLESQGAGGLRAQGQRIPRFCGKPLKTLRIAKRGAVDLRVRWKVQGQSLECRLIVTWNSSTQEFQYLATNLPPERYSVYEVAKAYRLRWQVELLFKEGKSYANRDYMDVMLLGGTGRTCMPSIPRTPPSSKGSSGRPSAPLR
ncbi:MAG: transposase [Gammaproteobacteria bacterium]